jgi:hypothetical protein
MPKDHKTSSEGNSNATSFSLPLKKSLLLTAPHSKKHPVSKVRGREEKEMRSK